MSLPLTLGSAPMVGRSSGESAPLGPTTPGTGAPAGQQPPRGPGMGPEFLFLMVGLLVFMFVMTAMSGRKEKRRRAQLLASIGRHDRVKTIGGMIGTVVEMHDDEVVLKVDDSTNTRIRFDRSAIQSVLKKASDGRSETSAPQVAEAVR